MLEGVDKTRALTAFDDSIRVFRTERLTTNGCGNKAFKLTKNLQLLKQRGCRSVLSFGGLWSNHLHALALACETEGLVAVAIVRGEETAGSELLDDAIDHGLQVHYASRGEYRRRYEPDYMRRTAQKYGCDGWLPEGGSNDLAVESCGEIAARINAIAAERPTHIVLAVGTGATMAGIAARVEPGQRVIGIPVVRDDRLQDRVASWLLSSGHRGGAARWELQDVASPKRYGKADRPLLEYVLRSYRRFGVVLDPVYNAKALRALQNSPIVQNPANDVVFVHTGGIGGCLGFSRQLLDIDSVVGAKMLAEVRQMLGRGVVRG